ncbi:AbrB/MazE/SpoVT family DNA-binding domain-containing protein [Polynucleobacter antarcticus]|uniref:AbrB family transcriptional regulator n=1 Tax=Polynucleobacter antarcticus TaxID=1743162 RepID=A0A6M9PSC0_9BURK|nr:AbrB/MazE/SpoVT family DNA-binding domain-containing protein [Polynucleobacter antarcticus]QKM63211.1 AbrB family transcriptional regulator [Polynucleobacter antarcticus]
MVISKWGNSLAIRLPAQIVEILNLKEGDDIEIDVASRSHFKIKKKPSAQERLMSLRKYRGRLPADFHFDRMDANER